MSRLRVGVIGCGLIAQVMHLPYLHELRDRFEVVALCDISPGTLAAVADYYGVARRYTRWQDLVASELDAVLILTLGSHHAPPAVAAAQAGLHVFVEKPMCYTMREADAMIAAAQQAGTVLMVGNMKRFDPAYEQTQSLVAAMNDLRLVRVTTLEAPFQPYVRHYPLLRSADVPADLLATLRADQEALLKEALGPETSLVMQRLYADVLLDSLVHEVNALRGVLGEPDAVVNAEVWREGEGITSVLSFGSDVRCVLSWVNLPDLPRYSQELAFYGSAERTTLRFPSPFLRSAPTALLVEEMDSITGATWEKQHVVSYEEPFKLELIHFHECVTKGQSPRTTAESARQDIAILQAIVRVAVSGHPETLA